MHILLLQFKVESAIRFLQNPRLKERPLKQRTGFLKSKGLTDIEIETACNKCGFPQNREAELENNAENDKVLQNYKDLPKVSTVPCSLSFKNNKRGWV